MQSPHNKPYRVEASRLSNRRGFTLIELLAATGLAAMLMVGVLAAVAAVVNPQGDPTRAGPTSNLVPVEQVLDLLREDLVHSSHIVDFGQDHLDLLGFSAAAVEGGQPDHRPVRTVYVVRRLDGLNWLLRAQIDLENLTNQSTQWDLICAGIKQLILVPLKNDETDESKQRARRREADHIGDTPDNLPAKTPSRVKVVIGIDGREQPIEKVLVIR
jgi:hypothetical protein